MKKYKESNKLLKVKDKKGVKGSSLGGKRVKSYNVTDKIKSLIRGKNKQEGSQHLKLDK